MGFVLASGIATGLVVLGPAACGGPDEPEANPNEPLGDARIDRPDVMSLPPLTSADGSPSDADRLPSRNCPSYTIELPDAGTQADPGALCTLSVSEVESNAAAVVSLGTPNRDANGVWRSSGSVTIPAEVLARVQGQPELRMETDDSSTPMVFSGVVRTATGFDFVVSWTVNPNQHLGEHRITVGLRLDCADAGNDAGTVLVTSRTSFGLCDDDDYSLRWRAAGEECMICRIIAEMAPSPVVSDNQGDDLPLGRVVQLRVVELARAGNQVLLFAESDAGADTDYTWNVSCGSLERLDADLVLWTLPDAPEGTPFGQLGVWNEHGAAVENFLWAVAA